LARAGKIPQFHIWPIAFNWVNYKVIRLQAAEIYFNKCQHLTLAINNSHAIWHTKMFSNSYFYVRWVLSA